MGRPAPRARLMALFVLLLTLANAPANAAAKPGATVSIVNGTPAEPGTHGPLAFVTSQISATSAMACTGTVIAPAVVLTAAHCLVDETTGTVRSASGVTVVTGRTDRGAPGGQVLTASRVVVHPSYDAREIRADVALILLSTATTAPPLAIVGPGEAAYAAGGTKATIAGWGLTSSGGTAASERLLSAATTILDDVACRRLLGADLDVVATLCAVDSPAFAAATCRGDSGGPLIVVRPDGTPAQAGVTSWGSQSCNARVPQAFARLSTYAGWISSQVAAAPTPPTTVGAPGDAGAGPSPSTALPVPPRGGEAAAAPALATAGWYRGRTAQRRAVAVRVAASGRAVAAVRVAVAGRCLVRARGARAAVRRSAARIAVAALPSAIGRIGDGRRFTAVRSAGRGSLRLHVTGRFAAGTVRGSVSASWRTSAGTRCSAGPIAFTARR